MGGMAKKTTVQSLLGVSIGFQLDLDTSAEIKVENVLSNGTWD